MYDPSHMDNAADSTSAVDYFVKSDWPVGDHETMLPLMHRFKEGFYTEILFHHVATCLLDAVAAWLHFGPTDFNGTWKK